MCSQNQARSLMPDPAFCIICMPCESYRKRLWSLLLQLCDALCYCSCVMAFKCQLTPLSINSLPKKAQIILCKTSLDPVRMAWSDFGQVHLVWKQASAQESLGLVLVKRSWPATSKFPTFRFSCVLPQTAQIISYKTSPDPVWFWLTVSGFGQTDLIQK